MKDENKRQLTTFITFVCSFHCIKVEQVQEASTAHTPVPTATPSPSTTPRPPYVYTYNKGQVINEILNVSPFSHPVDRQTGRKNEHENKINKNYVEST